jgi:hypothetical protein
MDGLKAVPFKEEFLVILRQGKGEAPDSDEAILRSR